ncbi:MAG: long-chain fatty acid--CoA ligase [Acidobacteria bacterium]|nr:long-chain fatty acid--CoA ligase [Acidobacteriota bacterium]MBI3658722.1 long-chain fatty acid--CoA ligase [Acidobacteriota bacterium]
MKLLTPKGETIPEIFFSQVERLRARVALRVRRDGRYCDITWGEFGAAVASFSRGLAALGVKPGETVAMISNNRPEFAYTDLGILSAGGITVAIYTSSTPRDIAYIINHSEARWLVVDNEEHWEKIRPLLPDLPKLEKIILMDMPYGFSAANIMSFAAVSALGERLDEPARLAWEADRRSIQPEDTLAIIYTSGTTGPPKGVMTAHRNVLFVCERAFEVYSEMTGEEVYISYLPLAHSLERIGGQFLPIYLGAEIGYAQRLETVGEDIKEIRPTVVLGVPRFFEKIYNRIMAGVEAAPERRRRIFYWALGVGRRYFPLRVAKQWPNPWLFLQYLVARILVFNRLRNSLGGRVRVLVSGGAPLNKKIAEFFYDLGLVILEGYGATETTAPATVNRLESLCFGTVGVAIPGVEIKLADDGEILIKGGNVFKGYFKDPITTGQVLVDGWYHSGDIGRFDALGRLIITDRKKDLIITAAGKNIAPQNIENFFKTNNYINEMVVVGDRRKYLTALFTLNAETVKEYAMKNQITYSNGEALARHPKILELIGGVVAEKNRDMASYEQIKKFVILPREFSIEAGELTPTMKIKRKFISDKYRELIDTMYDKEFSS